MKIDDFGSKIYPKPPLNEKKLKRESRERKLEPTYWRESSLD